MGPVAHLGIPLPVSRLLKLNMAVTGLCALLPDLVDKPLWALGIGNGRYVAHTLLFVFGVAIAFSIKKRVYGWSALLGGMLHLVLDIGGFVPWFYPFVHYDFPREDFTWSGRQLERLFLSDIGEEVLWTAAAILASFLLWRLYTWWRRRRKAGL